VTKIAVIEMKTVEVSVRTVMKRDGGTGTIVMKIVGGKEEAVMMTDGGTMIVDGHEIAVTEIVVEVVSNGAGTEIIEGEAEVEIEEGGKIDMRARAEDTETGEVEIDIVIGMERENEAIGAAGIGEDTTATMKRGDDGEMGTVATDPLPDETEME